MTDLHTHILPCMDDGSGSISESLRLLRMEQQQGVDLVCLTPHFSPAVEEASAFLRRRQQSVAALLEQLPPDGPELVLGAEVAWFPTIGQYGSLQSLRLGDSAYFLLELPFEKWTGKMLEELYRLEESTGLTPILAHVERYLHIQDKNRMQELLSMGLPMQMNASGLLAMGRKGLQLLKQGDWLLGSDCHDLTSRPPDLGAAAQYIEKKMPDAPRVLLHWTPDMV